MDRDFGIPQHLALPCQDPMLATLQRSISAEPWALVKKATGSILIEFAGSLGSAKVRAVMSNMLQRT